MKKIILLTLFYSITILSNATQFTVNNVIYSITSANEPLTVEVTNNSMNKFYYSGNITIPVTVDFENKTYSVTSIAASTFNNCTNLTGILLSDSILKIGDYAFSGCTGLTGSLNIPNSVKSIGSSAFYDCSAIQTLNIGNSVDSIGSFAFSSCTSLVNISLGSRLKHVGYMGFNNCTGITSINLPNSLKSLGGSVFNGCTSLYSISIPDSIESLGSGDFEGTIWLAGQPNGIVYFGKVLYKYKGAMPSNTTITVRDGTVCIAGSAFASLSQLVSISLPNSLKVIGGGAFSQTSGLSEIIIPDSVTKLGDESFYFSFIRKITLSKSLNYIGVEAFRNCPYLNNITLRTGIPPVLGVNALAYISRQNCVIEVPKGAISLFKVADTWSEFINYVETELTTHIALLHNEKIQIISANNYIIIQGIDKGSKIQLYSSNGQVLDESISTETSTTFPINNKGIFLIKTPYDTHKVMVY